MVYSLKSGHELSAHQLSREFEIVLWLAVSNFNPRELSKVRSIENF